MSRTLLLFVFTAVAASFADAAGPQIGRTPRYCNPLPMVTAPDGSASGDVTVIREQGKYYMYCVGGTPATESAAAATAPALPAANAYQYKIETSLDGQAYTTALDQTKNAISRNVIFEEIPPVKCRFVRLTLTNGPRTTPLGIIEFTVSGKPAESLLAAVSIPNTR